LGRGHATGLGNGLGLTISECENEITSFKSYYRLLADLPAMYAEWEALVVHKRVISENITSDLRHLLSASV
jgi:hypothetical protein